MNLFSQKRNAGKRSVATFFLVFIFVATHLYIPLASRMAHAQWTVNINSDISSTGIGTWFEQIVNTSESIIQTGLQQSLNIKEFSLDAIAWGLVNVMLKEMIKSTTKWVNSGFEGKPAFVTDLNGYLTGVADKVAGNFIWGSKELKFLCSPFALDVRLALDIYYKETRDYEAQCTLSSVVGNMNSFLSGNFLEGGWDGWYSVTQNPSNNPHGALILAQEQFAIEQSNKESERKNLLNYSGGFLSREYCFSEGDDERCSIETPGVIIQDQLNRSLGFGGDRLVIADEINELIGALFAQLASKALSGVGGLLALTESSNGSGGGYLDDVGDEQEPGDNFGGSTNVFDGIIEEERTYLDTQSRIIALIEDARTYKVRTYGADDDCSTGALTSSLQTARTRAQAGFNASSNIITRITQFRDDDIALRNATSSTSTVTSILARYGAQNTVSARATIMSQFMQYRNSGVLHTSREVAILENETIPQVREEIEAFVASIDRVCPSTGRRNGNTGGD